MSKKTDLKELFGEILSGHVSALSKGITLLESQLEIDRIAAQELVQMCLPHSGKSLRLGITGAPGVGKSTFIDVLGTELLKTGGKLAVLAIDPSSSISKGSILGDKTRMTELSKNPHAFIRPSPAGTSKGGTSRATREAIILCETAGFDHIFVETVGVGQSEYSVHDMVDFFLFLIAPSAGDELQGMKRGIMEMADLIIINKADSGMIKAANQTAGQYRNALQLFPEKKSGWIPKVMTCSALLLEGIEPIIKTIFQFKNDMLSSGFLMENRSIQNKNWLHDLILFRLQDSFFNLKEIKENLPKIELELKNNSITTAQAEEKLWKLYSKGFSFEEK